MKTGLETDAKQCLEEKKREFKTTTNRMKEDKEVFAVEVLKTKKNNRWNS